MTPHHTLTTLQHKQPHHHTCTYTHTHTCTLTQRKALLCVAYCQRWKQSLWYIGHDDANKEHNSTQPGVAQDHCNSKEQHPNHHSKGRYYANEVLDLLSQWGLCWVYARFFCENQGHHRNRKIASLSSFMLLVSLAMCPIKVWSPVLITTPLQEPMTAD